MTDPYGTVRAQIIDLQGNAIGGQPSNNDWRLVVDNEQLKFQHYDSTANSGNGAFLTRQSFGTGLTGINVVPQGTYSINGNLQVTDDLTVDGGSLFVDASTNRVGFGTLTPSQAVHIVGNTYVDGDLTVTGTASLESTSVWTKTSGTNEVYYTGANVGVGTNDPAAQLDVNGTSKFTGNMTMKGHIIPDATNTYDLGSATKTFRHVYVGPGSLYVNGKQVVTDDSGTITISTDADQNLSLKTSGSGNVQINSTGTGDLEFGAGGIIQMKKTLQMLDGQKITSSGSTTVVCGNNFQAEGSLRGTSLTLDGVNTVNSTELNVLDGVSPGTVAGSKAVVVDANKDIAGLRNVTIVGDLTVSGTTTTVNSTTVSVADSMFKYASANTADALDMGWYGKYVDSGVTKYSGMFRDATDGKMRLFNNTQTEPATTVDLTAGGYAKADLAVADIDFTSGTMRGSIIPDVNDAYDIGSAEFKIRDMYVSDSSLWIGDEHKVTISGGKMKFRKRKTTTVPAAITAAGGSAAGAKAFAGNAANLQSIKLKHWRNYLRNLTGDNSKRVKDVFRATADDYEEETGADAWLDNGANLYRASGNVGIGTSNPGVQLDVRGTKVSTAAGQLRIIDSAAQAQGVGGRLTLTGYYSGSYLGNAPYVEAYKENATSGNYGYALAFGTRENGQSLSEKMRISGNGNVGIGDSTPTEKLEVNGAIKIGNADNSVAGTIKFQGGDFYGAKTNDTWTSLTSAGSSSVWSEASSTASYGGNATITGTLKLNSTDGTEKIYLTTGGTAGSKIRTSTGEYVDFYAGDGGATTEGGYKWLTTAGSSYVERMRVTKEGRLGIGTATPGYTLDVYSTDSFTANFRNNIRITNPNGDDFMYFQRNDNQQGYLFNTGNYNLNLGTNNTTRMFIKGDGKVVIGAEVGSQGTANRNLNLIGPDAVMKIARNHASGYSPAVELILLSSNGNTKLGYWDMYCSGDTFNIRDRVNERVTLSILESNGNVGIGDTTPSYKLDVAGDINFTGTLRKNGTEYGGGSSVWSESSNTAIYANNVEIGPSNQEMKIGAIHGGWMGFAHKSMFGENTYAMIQSSTGDTRINIASGKVMGFMENNQWKMHLKGGKLGIGKQNAAYKLDVDGDINLTGDLRIDGVVQTFGGGGSSVWTEASNEAYYTTGNVGIGTNNPSNLLHIYANINNPKRALIQNASTGTSAISRIQLASSGTSLYLDVMSSNYNSTSLLFQKGVTIHTGTDATGGLTLAARSGSGHMKFMTGGENERMRIDSSGNVGIGQDSPSYKLDVTGTARITSDLTVGGNLTVSGTTTTVNTTDIVVEDSLIQLASNNSADTVDIGMYGKYVSGSTYYTGLVRDASEGGWHLFTSTTVPSSTGVANLSYSPLTTAALTCTTLNTTGNLGVAGSFTPQIHLAIGDNDTGFHQQGDGKLAIYTNNQERVRIQGANVGIGHTNPAYRLDVNGTSRFMGDGLYTAGGVSFSVVGSNTTSGGKVARIGVASHKAREAGFSLGNSSTTADCDERWLIGRKYNGGSNFSDIAFFYTTDNGGTNGAGYSEKMRITTDGKVAIGNTNPSYTLDVTGSGRFQPNTGQTIEFSTPGGETGMAFDASNANNRNRFDIFNFAHATASNRYFRFKYNADSTGLTIRKGGNVGIGKTAPNEKLDVNGAIKIGDAAATGDGTIKYASGDFLGRKAGSWVSLTATGGGGSSPWTEASSEVYYDGNVGIGTNNPQVYGDIGLQIHSASSGGVSTCYTNGTTGASASYGFQVGIDGNENGRLMVKGNDHLIMYTNDTERIRVKSSGLVGIGTNNPAQLLHVCGDTSGKFRLETTATNTMPHLQLKSARDSGGNMGVIQWWNEQSSDDEVCRISGVKRTGGVDGELQFYTRENGQSMTEKMVIEGNGYVGIGTGAPTRELDVRGNVLFGSTGAAHNLHLHSTAASTKIHSHSDGITYYQTQGAAYFGANSIDATNKPHIYIKTNGNVGIGNSNAAQALAVTGSIVASGNVVAYGSVSDRRLKENIADLSSASSLEKVLNMRTVSFKWVENLANEQRRGKQDEGFIAQEIEEMLPMLVGEIQVEEQDTPYKYIHYDKLTVYMAGAIQEQNKEITELKEENATLKAQLNSILERLSALESN